MDSIGTDAAGGEFERKGNSVEPAANIANRGRFSVTQLETAAICSCALNKQLHGRKGQRLGSRQV